MFLSKLIRLAVPARKNRLPKRYFRPHLDVLEDRRVLSTFTVDDDGPTGPKDFNTIQEAVDAAFANGPGRDTIKVKPGTYHENVLVNTTVTIQGSGTPVVDPVDDGVLGAPVSGFDLQANDIVIKGFRIGDFDGDTTATGGDGSVGITTSSLFSGYKIQNNEIENNVIGIYLNTYNGNAAKETQVKDNDIERNNVGIGVLPAAGNGIYSDQGARRVKISGNEFEGHENEDIIFVGGGAPTPALQTQLTIQHNRLIDSSGIFFIGVTNSTVQSNTIRRSFANAIELAGANINVTIKNNNLDHVGQDGFNGIYLHDEHGFGANINNLIQGNDVLYDGLTGIRVRDSNNNVVRGNLVIGSIGFDLSDENWGNGIDLQNGDSNTIEKNTLKLNARHGLFADVDSEGNLIKNNFSFLNGQSVPYGIEAFDYKDESVGAGTAGTANFYQNNKGRYDSPDGLIRFHI